MFMRNCESAFSKKGTFFNGELQSSVRSLNGSEILGFSVLCHMPIIMTSMPLFATYRVEKEQIILFMKIVNWSFERKECFFVLLFRSFDRNSVRIKGTKTLYLPVVHPKQATQASIYLT